MDVVVGAGGREDRAARRLSPADYLPRLEQAEIANSLDNLMTFPRLAKLIEKGKIATHGAYFGVATGDLSVLDKASGEFSRSDGSNALSLPGLTRQSRFGWHRASLSETAAHKARHDNGD